MKPLMILILSGMILGGCSTAASGPEVQGDCLEDGLFKYDDECVDWTDIPEGDQDDVMSEIADEIVEAQGVSKQEAYEMMWEMMQQVISE